MCVIQYLFGISNVQSWKKVYIQYILLFSALTLSQETNDRAAVVKGFMTSCCHVTELYTRPFLIMFFITDQLKVKFHKCQLISITSDQRTQLSLILTLDLLIGKSRFRLEPIKVYQSISLSVDEMNRPFEPETRTPLQRRRRRKDDDLSIPGNRRSALIKKVAEFTPIAETGAGTDAGVGWRRGRGFRRGSNRRRPGAQEDERKLSTELKFQTEIKKLSLFFFIDIRSVKNFTEILKLYPVPINLFPFLAVPLRYCSALYFLYQCFSAAPVLLLFFAVLLLCSSVLTFLDRFLCFGFDLECFYLSQQCFYVVYCEAAVLLLSSCFSHDCFYFF